MTDTTAELRKPGYWDAGQVRETFERIRDSLEEAKSATTVGHIADAATKGEACFCAATSCQQGCPLSKEVPSIMEALREVDFELISREFADVQQELDTYLDDYKDLSFEEYFAEARKGYVRKVNQLINGKPELKHEMDKLKSAYMLQVSASRNGGVAKDPFPEFTGMLCPAPCEGGGPEGPGCTLKESGEREPVRIRSTELDLATISFALGWMDEVFQLPASINETRSEKGIPDNEKIAVVGAGPAGLQTAYRLAMKGHHVTLFEKDDEIGGQMYRGIPNHKFEKERLAKYRLMLEKMGVEIRLGVEVSSEELEAYDVKVMAVGVMDGQIEPTWITGYDEAKDSGLTQDAYGFLRGGNEWASARSEEAPHPDHDAVPQGKQAILAYGDGYTATDVVQTLARMKEQNPDIVTVHAFRDTGVSTNVAGGFSIPASKDDYLAHTFSTLKQDKQQSETLTMPGANITSIDTHDDTAHVHFQFVKPEAGFGSVSRSVRKAHQKEGSIIDDPEAGGIYREGQLAGVRLRDANGNLHTHAYKGGASFDVAPSEPPIEGKVDGTLSLEFNRIIPALGARDASKNALVEDMGLNAKAYNYAPSDKENRDGIWNGVSMSQEGTFFVGDAGLNDQIIVSAQASANKVADQVERYLSQKRKGDDIDLGTIATMGGLGGAMERAA